MGWPPVEKRPQPWWVWALLAFICLCLLSPFFVIYLFLNGWLPM